MSSASDRSCRRARVARILLVVCVATALVAFYELRTYRRHVIFLHRLDPTLGDLILAYLSLWARALLWLVVPAGIAVGLALAGWRRAATGLAFGATLLCMLWFVLDARLMRITGTHVHAYLGFALDRGAQEWGGDLRPILTPLLRAGLGALAGMGLVLAAVHSVHRLPGLRVLAPARGWPQATFIVLIPLVLLVARPALEDADVLEQLYGVMPGRTILNDPLDVRGAGAAGFGVAADEQFRSAARMFKRRLTDAVDVRIVPEAAAPGQPVERPHVVLFILESFRHDAIEPRYMPRLATLGQRGLLLENHDSGSNRSELGAYGLLYGRMPLAHGIRASAVARPTPALLRLFGDAGYSTTLVASCPFTWMKMDAYFASPPFDAEWIHAGSLSWPERDRKSLRRVERILGEADDRPQLIVCFLMSSHWGYTYPESYAQGAELAGATAWEARDSVTAKAMRARYNNALRFLDDEVGGFVEGLDLDRHLVLVTGDHGESFRDDGVLGHASKLSAAQTGTSFLAVGRGVEPLRRQTPSQHVDLLPTLAHWLHPQGVRVSGADGVDWRTGIGPRDTVQVTPAGDPFGDMWLVVLRRGEKRLLLRYETEPLLGPRFHVNGFIDEAGAVRRGLAEPPEALPAWTQALETLLRR